MVTLFFSFLTYFFPLKKLTRALLLLYVCWERSQDSGLGLYQAHNNSNPCQNTLQFPIEVAIDSKQPCCHPIRIQWLKSRRNRLKTPLDLPTMTLDRRINPRARSAPSVCHRPRGQSVHGTPRHQGEKTSTVGRLGLGWPATPERDSTGLGLVPEPASAHGPGRAHLVRAYFFAGLACFHLVRLG